VRGDAFAKWHCVAGYHRDLGAPDSSRTVKPIEPCPFLMDTFGRALAITPDLSSRLTEWLDRLEREHPIVPGVDTVQDRQDAIAAWLRRL